MTSSTAAASYCSRVAQVGDFRLWESDGTSARTRMLADVFIPGGAFSPLASLTAAGPLVFFRGFEQTSGAELWAVPRSSVGLCGNHVVDPGETCDDGEETATCDSDCTPPGCGDGTTNRTIGETCDDGNSEDGDCCTAACAPLASGSPCADPNACNGAETCDGAGRCLSSLPLDCNDGRNDTADSCDFGVGCINVLICVGDCDGNGTVAINELVTMVNATLASISTGVCPTGDLDSSNSFTIDEIISAVRRALSGCA